MSRWVGWGGGRHEAYRARPGEDWVVLALRSGWLGGPWEGAQDRAKNSSGRPWRYDGEGNGVAHRERAPGLRRGGRGWEAGVGGAGVVVEGVRAMGHGRDGTILDKDGEG